MALKKTCLPRAVFLFTASKVIFRKNATRARPLVNAFNNSGETEEVLVSLDGYPNEIFCDLKITVSLIFESPNG